MVQQVGSDSWDPPRRPRRRKTARPLPFFPSPGSTGSCFGQARRYPPPRPRRSSRSLDEVRHSPGKGLCCPIRAHLVTGDGYILDGGAHVHAVAGVFPVCHPCRPPGRLDCCAAPGQLHHPAPGHLFSRDMSLIRFILTARDRSWLWMDGWSLAVLSSQRDAAGPACVRGGFKEEKSPGLVQLCRFSGNGRWAETGSGFLSTSVGGHEVKVWSSSAGFRE